MNARILKDISERMIERGETLAVAESVTAGLIMSSFSEAPNASGFFQGGITVYNLGQKTRQLNVEPIHAESINCVSEYVAQTMACDVSKQFCSQWGIAITGYATPVPALKIKTCFAIYAFAHKGVPVVTTRIDTKIKGQNAVKRYFIENVIRAFAKHVHE